MGKASACINNSTINTTMINFIGCQSSGIAIRTIVTDHIVK